MSRVCTLIHIVHHDEPEQAATANRSFFDRRQKDSATTTTTTTTAAARGRWRKGKKCDQRGNARMRVRPKCHCYWPKNRASTDPTALAPHRAAPRRAARATCAVA